MIPFFDSDRIHNLGSFTALSKINKKNNIIMFGQVIRQNLELIDTWIDLKFCSNLLSCFTSFSTVYEGFSPCSIVKKNYIVVFTYFSILLKSRWPKSVKFIDPVQTTALTLTFWDVLVIIHDA